MSVASVRRLIMTSSSNHDIFSRQRTADQLHSSHRLSGPVNSWPIYLSLPTPSVLPCRPRSTSVMISSRRTENERTACACERKIRMASKTTFETVRKIASAIPGVEESTGLRGTSLKIGGKMLACPAINKSAEPNSLVVRIDFDQRAALIAEAPETYYITDHYVNYPSVLVRLSRINSDALRDLLGSACRFVSGDETRKRPAVSPKRRRASPKAVR